MALQIEEFFEAQHGVPSHPPLAVQQIAIGASSTASAPTNDRTRFVRLLSDVECYYLVGSAPVAEVATAGSSRLPADFPIDIAVKAGRKIAVIEA